MYSRFSGIIIVGQHNPCTSSLTTQQNTSYYVLKKQRTTRAHPSLYAFLFLSATYSFELHPCTYIYSITPDPRCSCKINLLYRRQYTPPIRSTSSRTFITRALVLLLREAHNTYKAAQRYHVASELSFHWAQLTLNISHKREPMVWKWVDAKHEQSKTASSTSHMCAFTECVRIYTYILAITLVKGYCEWVLVGWVNIYGRWVGRIDGWYWWTHLYAIWVVYDVRYTDDVGCELRYAVNQAKLF